MAKLTKAQQTVIDKAKQQIAEARLYETFEDYLTAQYEKTQKEYYINKVGWSEDKFYKSVADWIKSDEWRRKYYESTKAGCPLITANTRTLKALEKAGLIEIVDAGGQYPDTIRIIEE